MKRNGMARDGGVEWNGMERDGYGIDRNGMERNGYGIDRNGMGYQGFAAPPRVIEVASMITPAMSEALSAPLSGQSDSLALSYLIRSYQVRC